MRFGVILAILFVLVCVPNVSAFSTDMKEVYQPGETMIITLIGNVVEPIGKGDVEFLRGHVAVPFDYDIKRIGEDYYVYAVIPPTENNGTMYSFVIHDLDTTVDGQNQKIEYSQNFTVMGEKKPYSITPGFFIVNDTFELTVNSYVDERIVVQTNFPVPREVTLNSGENTIEFEVKGIGGGIYDVSFGDYVFPVLLLSEVRDRPNIFGFNPPLFDEVILINTPHTYKITIINNGEDDLENVVFDYDTDLFSLTPGNLKKLDAGDTAELSLVLRELRKDIDSQIWVYSGNMSQSLPVRISYTSDQTKIDEAKNRSGIIGYDCAELSGKVCSASQTCSEKTVATRDEANCCIGICQSGESSISGTGWIGWALGVILVLVLAYSMMKYYKGKNKPGALEKRIESAEKKLLP